MAEQVSVQINWKHQFEFAAFYAALEQGYYRDAGLDVSIHEGGPGIDAVKEVVEGRADFGVGTSALVVERYHGQPVMALASLMQHSPIALMALRRNGVNSVHDLAGRPVAVDPHSRDEIDAYLRAAGIPPASIRFVDQTDWTLTSLEQGREAAKVVYVSNEPFFIRGREHEFIVLRPQSAGIDLFGNILFGTQAMVEGRPDTVKAFRDATLKGLVYAQEHPDELADLIHDRYNTQNKSREHLLFEAEQIRELTRPDIVEPGYMSAGRWQHVVNVYAGQGKMPANFNLDGFLFEPMPHKLPAWLVNSLLASVMLLLVTAAFMIRLRFINRKLANEMVERRDAEQKLAERERILAAIIDNEPECVKLLDKDGLLLRMNPAGLHMIEADSEAQVLGKRVEGLVLPPYKVPFVKLLHKVFRGERGTLEFEIQGMRGGRRWLETHAVPLRNETGEITHLLGVTRDVTALKQAEAELDRYQRGLEEVVAERTSELIAARDEAERLARVKSEFLANMSHEIRTPLNAVLGFARMGARDSAGRSCRETFGRIREAGEHLLGVINDILDFSKLDAGKLTVERHAFQLGAVLANTASIVTGTARHKGLAFAMEAAPDLPEWVMSDPQRLQQILINLLSNAVKFTAAGEVRLQVAREGDLAYFRVTDTGIGMNEEQLSRLFKPFEQADSTTTRNYGGTGLGLAISRDLANLMGGEITVESAPGQGSAFTLRLPLPTAQPALPAHTEPAAGPRLTGIKVLAAEDVEANRLILEDLLV